MHLSFSLSSPSTSTSPHVNTVKSREQQTFLAMDVCCSLDLTPSFRGVNSVYEHVNSARVYEHVNSARKLRPLARTITN